MKVKVSHLIIALIFFASMSFFYLLDESATIMGLSYGDIALLLVFIWSVYWIYFYSRSKNRPKLNSAIWFITSGILVITSSLQSQILYGQSLWMGIRAQRTIICYSALYFGLTIYCHKKKISSDELKQLIYKVAVFQLGLFLLQYLLVGRVQFLHARITYQSRGLRIYYLPVLIDLLFVLALDKFIIEKGVKKVAAGVIAAGVLFEVMVAQKFRMSSLGLILILVLFILLIRGAGRKKAVYLFIGALVIALIYNTAFVQDIISTLMGGSDINVSIREQARLRYLLTLLKHPLLGGGFPHETSEAALRASGSYEHMLMVDNGLFALIFMYGGLGIVWFVSLWIKQLKMGWKIRNHTNELAFFLFPFFFLLTGLSEAHWYWNFGLGVLVIFNVMADLKCNEIAQRGKDNDP